MSNKTILPSFLKLPLTGHCQQLHQGGAAQVQGQDRGGGGEGGQVSLETVDD